ncbi:MAG: hypothetical protein Kow00117_08230 [Phototrophicales bacterium]
MIQHRANNYPIHYLPYLFGASVSVAVVLELRHMPAMEYLSKALMTWFLGFFPLAEIYVAVPAGMALGLSGLSVVVWSVFGNFLPILLIHYGYESLMRIEWINRWLTWLASDKAKARMDRYGIWAVLVLTPWIGVWAMSATAKAFGMNITRLMLAALVSIVVYAVVIVGLISLGLTAT